VPRARATLVVALAVAAALRAASWLAIADGPLPELHRWTETDMSFFDRWARAIAAGDLLTEARMRPWHSGHQAIARDALAAMGAPDPADGEAGQQLWDRWLGARTFYQDPLYPYLVAGVYAATGGSLTAVFLLQALLGTVTVGLVWWLARRLFDPLVAAVAGLLAALYAPLVFHESQLLRTGLQAFLGTATVCALTAAIDSGRRVTLVAGGFLAALTFLTHSSALLLLAVAGAVLAWRHRRAPGALAAAAGALLLGFALGVAPLVARNVAVGAPPLGVASSGAMVFVNHNAVDGNAAGDGVSVHTFDVLRRTDGRFLPTAVEALRTHPDAGSVARLAGRKLGALVGWYETPNNANYYYYLRQAPAVGRVGIDFRLVGPLALAGLLFGIRRTPAHALALGWLGVGVVSTVLFFHLSRFRAPYVPVLVPFAAWTLASAVRAVARRRFAVAAGIALLVVGAGLLVWRPLPGGESPLRIADIAVPNLIAAGLARERLSRGDAAGALRLVERQIALEPPELRALDPTAGPGRVSMLWAAAAGSFAPLHSLAAEIDPARAVDERRRAAVLDAVGRQWAARFGDPGRRAEPDRPSP
jgi:4-amino-4-deoxy-L-arabinose transferase-like glycosyltransferase